MAMPNLKSLTQWNLQILNSFMQESFQFPDFWSNPLSIKIIIAEEPVMMTLKVFDDDVMSINYNVIVNFRHGVVLHPPRQNKPLKSSPKLGLKFLLWVFWKKQESYINMRKNLAAKIVRTSNSLYQLVYIKSILKYRGDDFII